MACILLESMSPSGRNKIRHFSRGDPKAGGRQEKGTKINALLKGSQTRLGFGSSDNLTESPP